VLVITLSAIALLAETASAQAPPMAKADAEAFCRANPTAQPNYSVCVLMAQMTPEQRKTLSDGMRKLLWGDAEGWAPGNIEIGDGWDVLAGTSNFVMFTKAGGGPAQTPRVWLRTEYRENKGGNGRSIYSMVQLEEFDCANSRDRTLQITLWPLWNMRGDSERGPQAGDWIYPLPNSVLEAIMKSACKAPAAPK